MSSKYTFHSASFNCRLVSVDGKPATPRAEKAELEGSANIYKVNKGHLFFFVPDDKENVTSPGFVIPFQDETYEAIGDEFTIISEDQRRKFLIRII